MGAPMSVDLDGMTTSEIIAEGLDHEEARWKYHALYQEALENQQAVRTHLRKAAQRALGKHLTSREARNKGQEEGSFSKNPDVTLVYDSLVGRGGKSGYYARYQGRELYISYSASEGIVGAYLLTLGLSDSEVQKGAKI